MDLVAERDGLLKVHLELLEESTRWIGSFLRLSPPIIRSVPVPGLPGCAIYHDTSIFDLVLPRILAGEKLVRKDIVRLAHGGLCVHCKECNYTDCGFGKGTWNWMIRFTKD